MLVIMPKNSEESEEQEQKQEQEMSLEDVEHEYNQLLVDASKVMLNPPATWNKYTKTKEGAMSILEMEFKELLANKSHKELLHVMAAAFNAWKYCHE